MTTVVLSQRVFGILSSFGLPYGPTVRYLEFETDRTRSKLYEIAFRMYESSESKISMYFLSSRLISDTLRV